MKLFIFIFIFIRSILNLFSLSPFSLPSEWSLAPFPLAMAFDAPPEPCLSCSTCVFPNPPKPFCLGLCHFICPISGISPCSQAFILSPGTSSLLSAAVLFWSLMNQGWGHCLLYLPGPRPSALASGQDTSLSAIPPERNLSSCPPAPPSSVLFISRPGCNSCCSLPRTRLLWDLFRSDQPPTPGLGPILQLSSLTLGLCCLLQAPLPAQLSSSPGPQPASQDAAFGVSAFSHPLAISHP